MNKIKLKSLLLADLRVNTTRWRNIVQFRARFTIRHLYNIRVEVCTKYYCVKSVASLFFFYLPLPPLDLPEKKAMDTQNEHHH